VTDVLGHNCRVNISAKADYAMRALLILATDDTGKPVKGAYLAKTQDIPLKFLENILGEMRHAGLVQSQRGADGGYWLAKVPDKIKVADVIRAVEGPLATVRGVRPGALEYRGHAKPLQDVWVALRANIRGVLESVTLADLVSGELPEHVVELTQTPDAFEPH
jgi:Rrf2 family protein